MKKILYFGGDIVTLEQDNYAEAVLTENGFIRAVGKYEDLANDKDSETELFDLNGKTMIPAFIDSHSHISAYAVTFVFADLTNAKSFEDIKNILINFYGKSELKENEWLIGFGYDHNKLKEKIHPDKVMLDSLGIKNPVLITHMSGHMGVLNSKGLEVLNIDSNTIEPVGGKIGRIKNTLEPNGYLEEAAFMPLSEHIKKPDINKSIELINKAQKVYASFGITTVQDGLLNKNELELLKKSDLYLDIIGYIDINKSPDLFEENYDLIKQYKNHFKILGIKIILDGSPQGRTAWLTKPYKNAEDGYCGYPVYKDDKVIYFFEKAIETGLQILVHCNGDAAAEQFIRCYKKALEKKGKNQDIRPVMIHAQLLRTDLLNDIKELNIIPSYFVAHTYYWGDVHINNLGKRAYSISPAGSSEKLDIKYTFHQDTPVLAPDMLKTIWCAVNRITQNGIILGKDEAVTPLQALKAVTINAAYQYFEENLKGSIKEGKEADFVILSDNPLKVNSMNIDKIEVIETRIKDNIVYRR